MTMPETPPTKTDELLRRTKNYRIVAIVVVGAFVVATAATLTGSVVKLSDVFGKFFETPAPTVSFVAAPPLIPFGETATLRWEAENATTVSIDQAIGQVEPSGELQVSPGRSITFTLTATNDEGETFTESVSVNVAPGFPQLEAWFSFVDAIKANDLAGAHPFLCDGGRLIAWEDFATDPGNRDDLLYQTRPPTMIQMGSWLEFGDVQRDEDDIFVIQAKWRLGRDVLLDFLKSRPDLSAEIEAIPESELDALHKRWTAPGDMMFVRIEDRWRFNIFDERSGFMRMR
jgi:hypothetical protein